MIGFIIALESETPNITKSILKTTQFQEVCGFKTYSTSKYVLIYSGVGKTNAAAATTILINNFKVKQIVNIGSAGSVNQKINSFEIFVPNMFSYFDVDVRTFGYDLNQIPHEQSVFTTHIDVETVKSLKIFGVVHSGGLLGTGETFVGKNNFQKFYIDQLGFDAIDMEACSIAQICNKNKVEELLVIKVISDSIFENNENNEQWHKNIQGVGNTINTIIELILSLN